MAPPPTQVETVGSSLDLGYVYVLDAGKRIYVWCGTKSPLMARSKARLICEKINKFERKNKSEIVQIRAVSCVCGVGEGCVQAISATPTHSDLYRERIEATVVLKHLYIILYASISLTSSNLR